MRVVPTLLLLLAFAPSLFAAGSHHSPDFREGLHYFAVPAAADDEHQGKLEVTQVFWYGCIHCFHFEPVVQAWQEVQPEDVQLVYQPAMWNAEMEAHARAYYTAHRLGVLEQAHQAIYNAINVDGERLDNPEDVAAFLAQFGVSKGKVSDIFSSPDATAFLKTADARARAYRISGTPQLIVNGRYRVQASEHLPRSQMFEVVDYLLEKIRAERGLSADDPTANQSSDKQPNNDDLS